MTPCSRLATICIGLAITAVSPAAAKMGGGQTSGSGGETLDKAVLNPPMGEARPSGSAEPERGGRGIVNRLSLSAGPAILLGEESLTAVSLNLRSRLGEADSPWSAELGGNWPATAPTDFRVVEQTINDDTYRARVDSLAETHFTLAYALPHGRQTLLVPTLGLGVSVLRIQNELHLERPPASAVPFETVKESQTSWSPLVQAGIRLFPSHRLSFSLDAAYVSYANTLTHGASFDLGIEGILLRPMLQFAF